MFPSGIVVREKLPALESASALPVCLSASVHSIREQPLHVKPPKLPVSLSPLLFQISSCLSQNLITMQKYEWDTASFSLTQRLYISNCNELLYFSKTYEVQEKDREYPQDQFINTGQHVVLFTLGNYIINNSTNWCWPSGHWRWRQYDPPKCFWLPTNRQYIPLKRWYLPTNPHGVTPEDGGSRPMFFRNIGICLQVHTALQPRRSTSTSSQPWEPQTLIRWIVKI
jgi:hypothetical protein